MLVVYHRRWDIRSPTKNFFKISFALGTLAALNELSLERLPFRLGNKTT